MGVLRLCSHGLRSASDRDRLSGHRGADRAPARCHAALAEACACLAVRSLFTPRPSAFRVRSARRSRARPASQLASLRGEGGDVTGSIARNPLGQVIRPPQPHEFPTVDRTAKGDRLSSKGDRLSIKRPEAEITVAPQVVQPEDEGDNAGMPANAPATPVANEPVENLNIKPVTAGVAAPLDPELEAALKSEPLPQYHASQAVDRKGAGRHG